MSTRSWKRSPVSNRPSVRSISKTSRRRSVSRSSGALKQRLNIPVFHDDQHGTAICVAAAALNALRVVGKNASDVRLVCSGAGAAAMACLDLLTALGIPHDSIAVCDRKGVLRSARDDLNEQKQRYALDTDARTLDEVIEGADIFLGLSGPGTLSRAMVETMGPEAHHPGARQPDAGNHARGRVRRAAGRDHCDRTLRLSEPGEQRPVLPLHLPRRARLRGDRDQHGDEACLRACDRRSRHGRIVGRGGGRLRRSVAEIRRHLHHSEALRSAPHIDRARRRCRGCDGERCGEPPDRRSRSVPAPALRPRVPHGISDEGGVRSGQGGTRSGSSMRPASTTACCAPPSRRSTRGSPTRS